MVVGYMVRVAGNQLHPPLVGIPPACEARLRYKGGREKFLLKSLGLLFAKQDQRFCAANLTRRTVR